MSDINHKLYRETEAAKALRANLADIIGDDEQCAADMVHAETNLNEAIDLAVNMLVEDKMALAGLVSMIDILDGRRHRIEYRMQMTKTALMAALEQAGKKKHEHAAATLTIKPTQPSVVVVDEALIPSAYWVAGEPKLSKKAVAEALKAHVDVPGATMSNGGQTLQTSFS